jgi:hypothetical protein
MLHLYFCRHPRLLFDDPNQLLRSIGRLLCGGALEDLASGDLLEDGTSGVSRRN